MAQAIESQLGSDLQQRYRLADEVEDVVVNYPGVPGCDDSSLG